MANAKHFNWTKGDIIRHIRTGQPLLVIHVYLGATVVVDLAEHTYLHTSQLLLSRDYGDWTNERDMEATEVDGKIKDWTYKPVEL